MSIRQSIQLAQKPRSTSVYESQQRLADDLTALFNVVNKLVNVLDSQNLYRLPVPATSTSLGSVGDFAYDTNYLYLCVGTDNWRRIPLLTF